ncbi:phosphatidylinositol 4-kinase [Endozoicomonas euniceicola]|uniref:Phosphatidylinositol 4-kinase n=1 Tax=Endozoicomonas euniceicola TaxID=1234143 RepID=A0ABY6GRE7_9GAMM|nr:phosphatidylinositol 4-kinase [Endozoicomonas euniceicola]UYM15327.1 phosphatidylinositol 4-kinase [Endozoicomonas euniceicola]
MPEPRGIQPNSQTRVHLRSNDALRKAPKKIGNAFNRRVFPHKAKKNLIQQQPPGHAHKSIHLRGVKQASPKNQITPPSPPESKGAQQPFQPRTSGEGAAIYKNLQYRSLVARERVTAQFEHPQQVSKNITDAAWSFYHQGNNSVWGKNHTLLAKAGQLGQVGSSINRHDQALAQPLSRKAGGVEHQGRHVIDNLQKGINQVDQLLLQQGHVMPQSEYQYLSGVKQSLQNEQKLMLQVMDDPGTASVSSSLNLHQAMELKRLGYDLTPTIAKHFSPFNDHHLIKGSDQKFGSGAIHSVTKLKFQTQTGVIEKIFKGEDPVDPCPFDSITGTENYLDKNKPRFAARNFAAAKFDNLLETGLMPKMELTVHDGKLGVLMDVAKGVKPWEQQSNTYNRIPVEDHRQPRLAANIQQQLNSAEWLDGICAQQDRHAGNLFVDTQSGKVTLIDNDMGFYPGQREVRTPSRPGGFRRFSGSTAGLPAVIDNRVYQKLMSITPKQIHQQMDGLLTPREIQSTVSRVQQLQRHARQLANNGRVIENWQKWKDPATGLNAVKFQRKYAPDSYLLSVQGQTRGL